MQHRLVVEQIDVGQTAALEKTEDAFCLQRKVRKLGDACEPCGFGRTRQSGKKHRAERDRADTARDITEKGATRQMLEAFVERSHGLKSEGRGGRRSYIRLIVSLRLSSNDATCVHAACSTGGTRALRGASPTRRSFSAAAELVL